MLQRSIFAQKIQVEEKSWKYWIWIFVPKLTTLKGEKSKIYEFSRQNSTILYRNLIIFNAWNISCQNWDFWPKITQTKYWIWSIFDQFTHENSNLFDFLLLKIQIKLLFKFLKYFSKSRFLEHCVELSLVFLLHEDRKIIL